MLVRQLNRRRWDFSFLTVAYAEIAESRNYLLTHWFDKTDASHILFIDADMGFEPDLIVEMVALNKPVVGVIYPRRTVNLDRIAELAARGETSKRAIAKSHQYIFRPRPRGSKPKSQNGFLEVDGCGTGIMLVQRSCIETMLRTIPNLSDTNKRNFLQMESLDRVIRAFDVVRVNGDRLSEDYSLCYRWRHLCKGEIWADQNREVVHMCLHQFKARYSDGLPEVTTGKLTVPVFTKNASSKREK